MKGPRMENHAFTDNLKSGLYRAIFTRRDVRGEFLPEPVPDEVLSRILMAAHHAPSVGFMQPWSFIVIRAHETKRDVHRLFEQANAEAAGMFDGERREVYETFKLEGILESPVNICVTCDRDRAGPVVLGRTHIKSMDLYSSVCAVQNLWLAARAEGIGVGWGSIYDQPALKRVLGIPRRVVPIAYLCLGYVSYFHEKPELETVGWRPRLPLDELVCFETWEGSGDEGAGLLLERIRTDQEAARQETFLSEWLE